MYAGRRMEERRRGDSVDLEDRERVARERVWRVGLGVISICSSMFMMSNGDGKELTQRLNKLGDGRTGLGGQMSAMCGGSGGIC